MDSPIVSSLPLTWSQLSLSFLCSSIASLLLLILSHLSSPQLRRDAFSRLLLPCYLSLLLSLLPSILQHLLPSLPPPSLCLPWALLSLFLRLFTFSLLPAMAIHLLLSLPSLSSKLRQAPTSLLLLSSLLPPSAVITTTLTLHLRQATSLVLPLLSHSCSLSSPLPLLLLLHLPQLLLLLLTFLLGYCLLVHHLSCSFLGSVQQLVQYHSRTLTYLTLTITLSWAADISTSLLPSLLPSLSSHPAILTASLLPRLSGLLLLLATICNQHTRRAICSCTRKEAKEAKEAKETKCPPCGGCSSSISFPSSLSGVPGVWVVPPKVKSVTGEFPSPYSTPRNSWELQEKELGQGQEQENTETLEQEVMNTVMSGGNRLCI